MKLASLVLLVATAHGALLGQSALPGTPPQTFHVRGTITDPSGAVVTPHVKVAFQGKAVSLSANVDGRGFYELDLPFGDYVMEVTPPRGFLPYRRPLFRVTSPLSLVLNASLPLSNFCDPVVVGILKSPCGGTDSFPVPATDGTPFEVHVRYTGATADGRSYASRKISGYEAPVLVEYNLFTLQAYRVTYDAKLKTVRADGNVLVDDGSGSTLRFDSATFRMESGQAIRVR